ncbi:TPA: hypothetical protein KEV05_000494 [Klebsiella oxytoca]|nr:hypothetical protein [Klebsiella oxytoca]
MDVSEAAAQNIGAENMNSAHGQWKTLSIDLMYITALSGNLDFYTT